MAVAQASIRPLPGVRFEVPPAQTERVLPRMDIAVLVGFAASGPLHRPVLVDSVARFTSVFGADLRLAWDPARGDFEMAYLGPAVRAFFRNGGQRCWVIRVAGAAIANQFPIPGVVQIAGGVLSAATAPARSEGSWSDTVRVSSGLLIQPVALKDAQLDTLALQVTISPGELVVGDLLRLTFASSGRVLFGGVARIDGNQVRLDRPVWFARTAPQTSGIASARLPDGTRVAVTNPVAEWSDGDSAEIELPLRLAGAPPVGALVEVDLGQQQLWLTISRVTGDVDSVHLSGQGLWWLPTPPSPLPEIQPADALDRLRLQLWTRAVSQDVPQRLSDLGFDRRHPRFWGTLPDDLDLFPPLDAPLPAVQPPNVWREVASPRFPLAGPGGDLFLPVAVPSASIDPLGPLAQARTALERDGLSTLTDDVFVDHDLAQASVADLMPEADFIRYQSSAPRELSGIHTAIAVDEATLVAVPDLVHRGWELMQDTGPAVWPLPPTTPPTSAAASGEFTICGTGSLAAPDLTATDPDESGTFTLNWTTTPGAAYQLQQASVVDFADADTIYAGPDGQVTLYGHAQGIFYYRVQASVADLISGWSAGLAVAIRPDTRWVLAPVESYSNTVLVDVQRALLKMCAARGDLLAILALPAHYREDDAISHAIMLQSDPTANSYGALYHPWLFVRESTDESPRAAPPDGAVIGVAAHRALTRGAWLSPANEPVTGVLALSPALSPTRWLDLQTAQINIARHEPRGFLILCEDTLASDPELRPINVRRLLQLLRRLALRLGNHYVFEPNDGAFRRLVQRAFELMLADLFQRGAFAGSTAATAFQVLTDDSINTPISVDQGRFIVELRVAPSQPLTFLTIRLIQLPDRGLVAQESA